MKDLWTKIMQTSGARAYNLVCSTLVFIITARLLGAEGRGLIVAVLTWVTLFSTLGHLSLGQVAIHRASRGKEKEWFSVTFVSLIFLTLIISLILLVIALFLYLYSDGDIYGGVPWYFLIIGFSLLPLQIWEKFGSSLLISINKLQKYNKALVIGTTLNLLLVIVLVLVTNLGILGVLISNIVSQLFISSAGFRLLWEYFDKHLTINWDNLFNLLLNGLKLHLTAIGAFLINKSDILMVNYFLGKSEVGVYQFAFQLITIMLIVPTSTLSVFYSSMAQVGPNQFWANQKKIMKRMLSLISILLIIAYFFAPFAIPLLAGNEFKDSVEVFQLLLISLLGVSFSTLMANQWVGRGLFWQNSIVTIIAGLMNVGLNLFWIPLYGINGAVMATIISTTVVTGAINLGMFIYCEKQTKKLNVLEVH